jgi:butyryl-CoA dehydrogenase
MLAAARLHRTAAVTAGRLVAPRRFSTALELPEIGEEHDMLKQMCRDFADAELKPIAGEIDRDHRYPATQIAKLGELGLMGVAIPEEYGGTGMDALAYAIAMEEISRGCASTGAQ